MIQDACSHPFEGWGLWSRCTAGGCAARGRRWQRMIQDACSFEGWGLWSRCTAGGCAARARRWR